MIHILAELAPLKVSDGSRPVLRASSAQDRALNGVASQKWWPAISKRPALAIPLFDGDFTQDVEAATASFTVRLDGLVNLDSDARGYRWAGAPVSIYAIDTSTALNAAGSYDVASLDSVRAFKGRVEGFNLVSNALTITAEIDKEPFEKDVLALTYAGTGDAEGGQDLKGRLKPWIFGRALNVEPILVNSVDSVVQFSAYPVQGISALYERGASFGPSIGNYATYAALVAANIPAGKWATCHALGMARLGAPPYGVITGDVDGDNTSGFLRRTGAIIQRIATARGIATALIDTASLNALDAAVPYDINLVLTEQISVLDLARRLARPCNAQAGLDFQGRLFAVRPTIGTPALTLDAQGRQLPPVRQCQEAEVSAPYKRIMFGANRSWRVHTFDEIAFDAELIDRGDYDPAKTYRRGNIVSLPNGSRWLYVNDTPKAGSMPSETNADWELMTGAITAGNITYEDGTPVEALKPAEPGATDGMNDEERDEFDQLAADTAAAQANIAAAQAQIAAIESSVSADFSEVNAALSTLNGEVDTAQGNISSLQSTTGQLSGSVTTLQGQVATAQNNITSLQSSTSSLNTAVTTLQGQVSTAQTNISSLQSQAAGIISDVDGLEAQIIAQGGQISTLQTAMSTQGAQISTLQTTVSNAVGDVATLKTQINAGGGNLLVNTDFGLDTSAWNFAVSGSNGSVPLRNSPSSDYYPPNENTLVTQQNNTTSTGYADWTQTIEVAASKWYDVSVYAGSHRCQIQIYLMWLDSTGAAIGSAPSAGPFGPAGGGNTLGSFIVRSFKAQAPAGAVRARLYLRKFGTNSGTTDSWAWFLRPQVVEVLAGTATPVAYSPGSARSTISVQATALSSLTTTVSTLSTTVSTQGGSISTLQSSVTTLQGSVSTLQTTVSTQGTNITSLQTAVSTAQGDLATLKTQVTAGGGNLLVNTDFANASSDGWTFSTPTAMAATGSVNGQPAEYRVVGENNLTIMQPDAGTSGYAEWRQTIPVEAGKWYDVSGYYGAHRCTAQVYLQWLDASGAAMTAPNSGILPLATTGTTLAAWARFGFKAQAPVGAVRANLLLRKLPTSSGSDSWVWFLRPQVAETLATSSSPLAYSPGSARSVIATQAQALSTATSSLATLSTTVSTQGGSITSLQSSFTTLNGTVSSLSTTVSTQGGSISTLQSSMSTAQGNISTLQSTVSTQGGQISTLQSTQSTQGTDLATLKTQVTAGGGNLLVNTDLGLDTSGWGFSSTHSATYGRNLPNSTYYPPYENTLTIVQSNNTTTGNSDLNQIIEVTEGKWYDVSCYCASHRCQTAIYIQWLDSSGTASFGAPATAAIGPVGGGNTLGSFTIRSVKAQAPTGAVRARFILRKLGTISGQADSYAWFLRPQVVEVLANTATPVAYSPGSARASIVTQANALSTLNTSFSSLSTTVSTQGGSISTLQSSMTSAQGSISTLQSTVSTQGGQISTLQSTSSTQAGQISTLQSTVSTQGGSISTMQSTLTTLQGTVSTLSTVVTASSNPNIVPNGGFENGFTGWTGGGVNAGNWSIQNWVWGYWAANSGWTGATNSNFAYIDSTPFGVAGAGNYVTQSFDVDFQGGAGCVAYGSIIWLNSSGGVLTETRGQDIAPRSFDATGNSRAKITHAAPSGAQTAFCRIVFYAPNGAAMSAVNVRHVKVEFGSVATPYSGEATAGQMYQAYSTLNTSFASLSTTVSSQGGSISTLQSSFTSLSGTVSTLSGTVSAQGSSISTLQSASSTQAGLISTLQSQVRSGGGNLLVNTDVATDLSGWTFSSANGSLGERVASGDQWIVAGENGLRTSQPNTTTAGQGDWTQEIAVEEGKWYDVSVYAASHRANIQIYLQFIDASGTVLSTPNTGLIAPAGGGNTLANFVRRSFKGQAPTGTVKAKLYLRKFGTLSSVDSYAWWLRPQVVETTATSATPVAYSPGSARATIQTQAQAISTATASLATLSTTVSTQGGSISTLQSSMSTAQGNISTLQSTVSAQGTSISTLQSAVSTAQGDVATLKTQVTAGGGNLLVNTDAAVDISGWSTGGTMTTGAVFGINIAGDAWRPIPDNILGIQQANTESSGYQEYTQLVAVQANKWYYASVYAASHRCSTALYVQFLNSSGNVTGGGIGTTATGSGTGGNTLAAYALMSGKAQAPADAVTARFFLRKMSTSSGQTPDSYAWFCRPQLAETTANATTPPAYAPGSARASIQMQASALSTLNTQYASLSSTVSTQGVTISTQSSAISTLNGNVAALFGQWGVELDVNGYVSGIKTNNNGTRADMTLRMDKVKMITPSGLGGYWQVTFDSQGRPTQTIGDDASGVTIEIGYLT